MLTTILARAKIYKEEERKMNIVKEIREKQNELITMVNSTFDELVRKVEKMSTEENKYEKEYETIYPITNATGFKGKKPIAIIHKGKRKISPTWKIVVKNILEDIIKDETMKNKVMALRDKLLGRVRKRLSKTSDDMRSPLKICDDLFIETHYDTESLIKLLLEILEEISYDYNEIQVVIKN